MPPHGPGVTGATHSHDVNYPDDEWNLYSMLDPTTTMAFNITKPQDVLGVFKPHAHRLSANPELISDADAEIIIVARFTSPVHLRKLMVIGGGEDENYPTELRCFVNQEGIDFTSIEGVRPSQVFQLPIDRDGVVELTTAVHAFTNIMTIGFYFPGNYGGLDTTVIRYIGMQGEHTHYRREAVNTVYEVLCNGQDIIQPDGTLGSHADHMH
eukprot:gene8134-11012_t